VTAGSVSVDHKIVGSIETGLVVLVGVGQGDTESIADRMIDKLLRLRIFADEAGKMNLSVADIAGGLLLISQFTLYADCRKGRRPSFTSAADPPDASRLYRYFVDSVVASGLRTQAGVFAADMKVSIVNDGPVTIVLDSAELGF
jgi:D-tyrosyl-tRNA(Tyr) deacylase